MRKEDFEWKEHTGRTRPVSSKTIVAYITVYETETGFSKVSHIHAPVRAELLTWSEKPQIGRIHKYAVIPQAK